MSEYRTTSAEWHEEERRPCSEDWTEPEIPDPVAPDEKGWRLVGFTATAPTAMTSGRLFWAWERA